jgi:phenylalanyl-tRNA synthetase beta chain
MDKEEGGGLLMPVISVSSQDLKSLLGRKVSDDELESVLPLNKLEIESREGDELRVEVTPDRPDLLSAEGIARQLNSWLSVRPGLMEYHVSPPRIEVRTKKPKLRPCFTCAVVRGLKLDDLSIRSLMQLQEMVDLTLGRDRKKVAIGIHDVSRVKPPFTYTDVNPGSVSFVPLGSGRKMNLSRIIRSHPKGIRYAHLTPAGRKWPIITDADNRVLSFPPIINGELTKVRPSTTDLFLDITGPDDKAINFALNILLAAMADRGGRIEAVMLDRKIRPDLSPRKMRIRNDDVRSLLGMGFRNREIESLLRRMGYGVLMGSHESGVLVPAYRADILHPVDIIEDIAISHGLNNFTPEVPRLPTTGGPDPLEDFTDALRNLMLGTGYTEMTNLTLTSRDSHFRRMNIREAPVIELANPTSQEHSICREWILPSLMENLTANKHRRFPQRIFEVSDCVLPDGTKDVRARNVRKLSLTSSHSAANLSEIISVINALSEGLGIPWELKPHTHRSFIPGRCGKLLLGKETIGIFGELHPEVITNFGLKMPVVAAEIEAGKLLESLSQRASQNQ